MSYLRDIYYGGLSLVEGMAVTFRRLFHPLVTVQYPRKKIPLFSAFRGHTELKIFKDTGTHKCIACGQCEKVCPSNVIQVQGKRSSPRAPKLGPITSSTLVNARFAACASKSALPTRCNSQKSISWSV